MDTWTKPKSIDWKGLPSFSTSFCIFTIRDVAFSPELMILLVYNHAESEKNKKRIGKPPGYGMPGGGLNPEWLESPEGAAMREGSNESGVKVERVRFIPIQGDKNKALIFNKKTGEFIRSVFYSDSKQVRLNINSEEMVTLNPLNYYLADLNWFSSKTREFFLGFKNKLISDGFCNEEAVARQGISINTLLRDELLALNVHREEVDEIGGFALLPVSLLRNMREKEWFYLHPNEDRENRMNPTSYIYRSHLNRILQGLDIMGVV